MTIDWKKDGKRFFAVLFAGALFALNIKIFVRTGNLFPGGATGLTVLIQRLVEKYTGYSLPYTPVNLLLNAFPVYIGFRYVGKKFTLLSLLMILVSGTLADLIPAYIITEDMLLIAVFGGILGGTAVSICLLVDATSGGTDFIAIFLSQKYGMETWNLVLAFNVVILSVAGFFFGWDRALYSIIYQFVSTQTMHTLYRTYQQQTLFIVTTKAAEVCAAIHKVSHHGATILDAEGSYDHRRRQLVYSVVSGADARAAINAARSIDPDAFINSLRTTELRGNFYVRPKD